MMRRTASNGGHRVVFIGVCAALIGGLAEQFVHEATHAMTALLFGASGVRLQTFVVHSQLPSGVGLTARLAVPASAALVNIVTGTVCMGVAVGSLRRLPIARLVLFYFAAYSLLAGFGYLMFDSIFYSRASDDLGDWKRVIALLGGGWALRGTLLTVGAVGYVATMFWMARGVRAFGDPGKAAGLMLVPYVATNFVATALALSHPLGIVGTILVAMKYWMGFSPFIWSFLMARDKQAAADASTFTESSLKPLMGVGHADRACDVVPVVLAAPPQLS